MSYVDRIEKNGSTYDIHDKHFRELMDSIPENSDSILGNSDGEIGWVDQKPIHSFKVFEVENEYFSELSSTAIYEKTQIEDYKMVVFLDNRFVLPLESCADLATSFLKYEIENENVVCYEYSIGNIWDSSKNGYKITVTNIEIQNFISDLSTIRSGAALGATSLQPENVNYTDDILNKPSINGVILDGNKSLSDIGTAPALQSNITYYVSSTGNDDTGDGTENNPFASIQHALSIAPKNLNGYTLTINCASTINTNNNIQFFDFEGGNIVLDASTIQSSADYIIHVNCTATIKLYIDTIEMLGSTDDYYGKRGVYCSNGIVYIMTPLIIYRRGSELNTYGIGFGAECNGKIFFPYKSSAWEVSLIGPFYASLWAAPGGLVIADASCTLVTSGQYGLLTQRGGRISVKTDNIADFPRLIKEGGEIEENGVLYTNILADSISGGTLSHQVALSTGGGQWVKQMENSSFVRTSPGSSSYAPIIDVVDYASQDDWSAGVYNNNFVISHVTATDRTAGTNNHKGFLFLGSSNGGNVMTDTDVNTKLNRTTAVNAADASDSSPTPKYMARGEALASSDTNPTANGTIVWIYK